MFSSSRSKREISFIQNVLFSRLNTPGFFYEFGDISVSIPEKSPIQLPDIESITSPLFESKSNLSPM